MCDDCGWDDDANWNLVHDENFDHIGNWSRSEVAGCAIADLVIAMDRFNEPFLSWFELLRFVPPHLKDTIKERIISFPKFWDFVIEDERGFLFLRNCKNRLDYARLIESEI